MNSSNHMKMQKFVIFVKNNLKINILKIKIMDHCHCTGEYSGDSHNVCNLGFNVLKGVPIVFRSGSNSDYHFIIKELAEEFEKQFTWLGENTEKYITFSVLIGKEVTRIGKKKKFTKTMFCRLQFIDSGKFMASSLSNLVDNLGEGIYKIKCKSRHGNENVKFAELNTKIVSAFLYTQTLNMI